MRNKLMIIGAGGQGAVCADVAKLCGYNTIEFLDDVALDKKNVKGPTSLLPDFVGEYDIFVAIGDNATRRSFIEKTISANGNLATLIHPSSIISDDVKIGAGTVVTAGAVINPGAVVGTGVIVNTLSSVDHNCELGDYSHIGVGSHLAGTVKIGAETFVGAGAVIINNISIAPQTVIGAGAVVIKDLTETGTYVGVPVRKIK